MLEEFLVVGYAWGIIIFHSWLQAFASKRLYACDGIRGGVRDELCLPLISAMME